MRGWEERKGKKDIYISKRDIYTKPACLPTQSLFIVWVKKSTLHVFIHTCVFSSLKTWDKKNTNTIFIHSQKGTLNKKLCFLGLEIRFQKDIVRDLRGENGRCWSLGFREEQGAVRCGRDEDRLGWFSWRLWAFWPDFSPCC